MNRMKRMNTEQVIAKLNKFFDRALEVSEGYDDRPRYPVDFHPRTILQIDRRVSDIQRRYKNELQGTGYERTKWSV